MDPMAVIGQKGREVAMRLSSHIRLDSRTQNVFRLLCPLCCPQEKGMPLQLKRGVFSLG